MVAKIWYKNLNETRVKQGGYVAFDTETTGLDPYKGDAPFAISFCDEDGDTEYYEWPVEPDTRRVMYEEDVDACLRVRKILEDPYTTMVGHNVKFDVRMVEVALEIHVAGGGGPVAKGGRLEETMFAAHACNTQEQSYGLKQLSKKYLGIKDDDQKDLKAQVMRARRYAKKLNQRVAGSCKLAEALEADYWLPAALARADNKRFGKMENLCRTYAVLDAVRTMQLFLAYRDIMREEGDNIANTYNREIQLWPVTYRMESRGVRVNLEQNKIEMRRYAARAIKWRRFVERSAWPGFNINSNPQLATLFYDKLELPPKTGKRSVSVDALQEHEDNEVVDALFKYRAAEKGLSSFFRAYRNFACPDPLVDEGWCIHPNFNQVGPSTGRYSCRSPNFQNVANALTTRSSEPIQARTPLGPRQDYLWFHIDYQQLEVRIFADVSQDAAMLEALNTRDLHTECTNKAWGGFGREPAIRAAAHALELDGTGFGNNEEVLKVWKEFGVKPGMKLNHREQGDIASTWMNRFNWDIVEAESSVGKKTCRARAKMLLFTKVFGGGVPAVTKLLRCSRREASQFLSDYDDAFPGIQIYIDMLTAQARADGFINNRYGRRIKVLPDKPYRAVNYMVQGSAADLLKVSMVRCDQRLRELGIDAHLVMTIHDEIVFEFHKRAARKSVIRQLCDIMSDHQGHFGVDTPVEVEMVRERWDIKEKVKL